MQLWLHLVFVLCLSGTLASAAPAPAHEGAAGRGAALAAAGSGVSFVENRGQWATDDAFVAWLPRCVVRVGRGGIGLQIPDAQDATRGVLVRAVFEGANEGFAVEGEGAQDVRHSFFLGNDPAKWQAGIPGWDRVRLRGLSEGVDLVLSASEGVLEYELDLAREADATQVRVRWEGLDALGIEAPASLELEVDAAPLIRMARSSHGSASLAASAAVPYWATYLGSAYSGGGDETVSALALDPQGNLVAAGQSGWIGFPTTAGSYVNVPAEEFSVFVARFETGSGRLLASSLLGGSHHQERATGVAVDAAGNAVVAGWTFSNDFPVTPGAYDTTKDSFSESAFVAKLSPDGSNLLFSTFLEGTNDGSGIRAIAVASSGAPIVAGYTFGSGFPITANAFDKTGQVLEGFVTRLDPTGSSIEWSTYLGGVQSDSVLGLAVDEADRLTCIGTTTSVDFPTTAGSFQPVCPSCTTSPSIEGFVARLSADGSALLWSSYLGGRAEDQPLALALDPAGGVLVGGTTVSIDFPVTPDAFQIRLSLFMLSSFFHDAFLTRISPDGSRIVYSTYFGDVGLDSITGVAIDASGVMTFGGWGGGVPVTPGALFTAYNNTHNQFVSRLDPKGRRLLYSTYLGGPDIERGLAMATTPTGRVAIGGFVYFGGFPTTPNSVSPNYNGGQTDAVLASLDPYLEGVDPHGLSTPACHGPLTSNASLQPTSGAERFSVYCSKAPPEVAGWLLVSAQPDAGAATFGGATLWVDRTALLQRIPVTTDRDGWAEASLGHWMTAPGATFATQFVFPNGNGCSGPTSWCASNALVITVQ